MKRVSISDQLFQLISLETIKDRVDLQKNEPVIGYNRTKIKLELKDY